MSDMPYLDWAGNVTNIALNGPLPNTTAERVEGTPYVIIDGEVHKSDFQGNPSALAQAIEQAKIKKGIQG